MSRRSNAISFVSLNDRRSGIFLFICGFMSYVVLYFGRLNYSAAMASVIAGGSMTREAAAALSTAFYVAYGSGTFINGFLGDRLSPFNMIGRGILLSGAMNLVMGAALGGAWPYITLVIIWAANGFVQSSVWSPLIRIISTILPEEQRAPACSNILITTAVGTFGSYILSTVLLRGGGFVSLFIVPGFILLAFGTAWFFMTRPIVSRTLRISESDSGEAVSAQAAKNTADGGTAKKWALLPLFISSGVAAMLLPVSVMSMINNGVSNWTPTIITEMFLYEPSMAVLLTALLPFGNIFGAVVSHIVISRWLRNEIKASVFFFGAAFVILCVMFLLGENNVVVMIVCLALVSALMVANSNIYVSFIPSSFGKFGRAATVAGIVNATANLFGSLSSVMIGYVTGIFSGWRVMFGIWVVMCAAGIVFCFFIISRWQRFKQTHSI